MKDKFKIGEIVRTECSAIGRYIGNGNALYVSAMTNDLIISKAVKKDKNKHKLPLPDNTDINFHTMPKRHRHKWEQIYCDCPDCGKQEHIICDCGEEKD